MAIDLTGGLPADRERRPDGPWTAGGTAVDHGGRRGGEPVPTCVIEAPWPRRLVPSGDPVPVVFESELCITRIEGVTVNTSHDTVHRPELPDFPVLFQGERKYSWDGEETYGMRERSTVRDQIEWV
jgi:hypothetical protein